MLRPCLALGLALATASLGACGGSAPVNGGAVPAQPASSRVGHVFVIVLENKDYDTTFGNGSPAPYLAQTLPAQGALLQNYYGIGHESLDNYIAMVSGQGPNLQTQSDCQIYTDFIGTGPLVPPQQAVGTGCVYPTTVASLPDQLEKAGLSWKGYMEDMGQDPSRESATCGHPPLNRTDNTQKATAGDQYATRHNPFVYFHAIIDDPARCDAHVVNLAALPADLASAGATPNFVFITPNLCNDGHDAPCANGDPGGLISANAFLQKWVPQILAAPAFRKDGLLIVTFDESDGPQSDASACCGEGPGPNTPLPGITGLGGGRIGAVLLSPFIKPGTVSATAYNHYSLLRTVEDLFGLAYLGYAGASGQASFGADVFTNVMPELPPKQ
ncbi:MAG: phosphoesterase [Nevskia sp.]|nr:phosphoesterase [Nevskia sp.]